MLKAKNQIFLTYLVSIFTFIAAIGAAKNTALFSILYKSS